MVWHGLFYYITFNTFVGWQMINRRCRPILNVIMLPSAHLSWMVALLRIRFTHVHLLQRWSAIEANDMMTEQESSAVAKMAAWYALYMGALKFFGTAWLRPRLLFPTFYGLCSDRPREGAYKIWSPFYPFWDNRGTQKFLAVPGHAITPY